MNILDSRVKLFLLVLGENICDIKPLNYSINQKRTFLEQFCSKKIHFICFKMFWSIQHTFALFKNAQMTPKTFISVPKI